MKHHKTSAIPWLEELTVRTLSRIDNSVILFALLLTVLIQTLFLLLLVSDSPIYFLNVEGKGHAWPVYR